MEFVIRQAVEEEIPIVLQFIREIAEYERMSDQVIATEELLREWLFEKKIGEVLIASHDGQDVGFTLYFHNFSDIYGTCRAVSGRYLCQTGISRTRPWQAVFQETRADCRAARVRTDGVDLPELEYAQHSVL